MTFGDLEPPVLELDTAERAPVPVTELPACMLADGDLAWVTDNRGVDGSGSDPYSGLRAANWAERLEIACRVVIDEVALSTAAAFAVGLLVVVMRHPFV